MNHKQSIPPTVYTSSDPAGYTICKTVTIYHQDDWKAFQELIQRGINLWPDAPAAMKELGDLVTNGEILQNYRDHSSTQLKT